MEELEDIPEREYAGGGDDKVDHGAITDQKQGDRDGRHYYQKEERGYEQQYDHQRNTRPNGNGKGLVNRIERAMSNVFRPNHRRQRRVSISQEPAWRQRQNHLQYRQDVPGDEHGKDHTNTQDRNDQLPVLQGLRQRRRASTCNNISYTLESGSPHSTQSSNGPFSDSFDSTCSDSSSVSQRSISSFSNLDWGDSTSQFISSLCNASLINTQSTSTADQRTESDTGEVHVHGRHARTKSDGSTITSMSMGSNNKSDPDVIQHHVEDYQFHPYGAFRDPMLENEFLRYYYGRGENIVYHHLVSMLFGAVLSSFLYSLLPVSFLLSQALFTIALMVWMFTIILNPPREAVGYRRMEYVQSIFEIFKIVLVCWLSMHFAFNVQDGTVEQITIVCISALTPLAVRLRFISVLIYSSMLLPVFVFLHSMHCALPEQNECFRRVMWHCIIYAIVQGICLSSMYFMEKSRRMMFIRHKILHSHEEQLQRGKEQADAILRSIFPLNVIDNMGLRGSLENRELVLQSVSECTILEADIVNFTTWTANNSAKHVVNVLNSLFIRFDTLCEEYHVQRLKIVGDCIICMGTPEETGPNHVRRMVELSCRMQNIVKSFNKKQRNRKKLAMRIGISTGSCITACIGKRKLSYEAIGTCVEEAQLLEKFGRPGWIHISPSVRNQLLQFYRLNSSLPNVLKLMDDAPRKRLYELGTKLVASYEFDPEEFAMATSLQRLQPLTDKDIGALEITERTSNRTMNFSLKSDKAPERVERKNAPFWTKYYDLDWRTTANNIFDTNIFGFFVDAELESDFRFHLFELENSAFLRVRQFHCFVLIVCHILARAMIVIPNIHNFKDLLAALKRGSMIGELSATSVVLVYAFIESLTHTNNAHTIQTSQLVHIIMSIVFAILNIMSPAPNVSLALILKAMSMFYISSLVIYTVRIKLMLSFLYYGLAIIHLYYSNILTVATVLFLSVALVQTISIHLAREIFSRHSFVINSKTISKTMEVARVKAEADRLLLNIIPRRVLTRIKRGDTRIFDAVPRAAVLFFSMDTGGLAADQITLEHTIQTLHKIFTRFDDYSEQYKCEKIKNVSSTYLAVQFDGDVEKIVQLALSMACYMRDFHDKVEFRIGVDVGSLIAVILGNTKPCYDVVGDVVNVAARLMQTCEPYKIQATQGLVNSLIDMRDSSDNPASFKALERGVVDVKGKGEMKTYWIE